MAAKASITDIADAGFRAEQFGTPPDWATDPDGYLYRILARAEVWSRNEFGSGYDAVVAASATFEQLRSAELCWVKSELWKRRAAFIDSNAASSLEGLAYLDRREFEAQSARAWECALDWMSQAKGEDDSPPGSAVVLTHVTTGPFEGAEALP